jgi:small conductance mechanosensitive channel
MYSFLIPVPAFLRAASQRFRRLAGAMLVLMVLAISSAEAQGDGNGGGQVGEPKAAPEKVDVEPVAADSKIAERLRSILTATGWFSNVQVRARDGVVFLDGLATSNDNVRWAGDLARKTESVVAVVNRMEVDTVSAWDLRPAAQELRRIVRDVIQGAPLFLAGVLTLVAAWWAMLQAARGFRLFYQGRMSSRLLADLAALATAVPILLVALYLVLQVSGLTRLALTVIGGTGLAGIIVGFAFRDIAENFLASVLLSVRQPFARDDLIDVAGFSGTVQQLNTRSTILMTADGNHVQIPNATVYKSTIVNYSANPFRRDFFTVGIGYDEPVSRAQEILIDVMEGHPAIADDPEPMVLVSELGAAAVNLTAYYWYDGRAYSEIRVKSALLRLSKKALLEACVEMPGETREIVFPGGVPIAQISEDEAQRATALGGRRRHTEMVQIAPESEAVATAAEGGLESEAEDIRAQARNAASPEGGRDLLDDRA